LPKKQDKEFDRIMGKGTPKIRSCFISAPGNVLIEADFKSAEIYTLGYLANCPKLIKDAGGDLHARGAVTRMGVESWPGFDQYIPPPEEWLSKNKALRIANKTVSFGIPYQRGPKAIAREITKSTKGAVECSKDQAQSMIDDWYGEYTEVYDYVQMCKASVKYPSYLDNPFGRRRRFSFRSSDQAFVAAQEREAVNFPIQSTVADILNVGLARLYWLRFQMVPAPMYKILLAIHDAVLLEVPGEHVRAVIDTVLPRCLHDVVAPSWQPREDLTPTKPFQLDIDVSVCVRWGETPSADELLANGVPEDLVAKYATKAH
jgi:DNA polymerase-1